MIPDQKKLPDIPSGILVSHDIDQLKALEQRTFARSTTLKRLAISSIAKNIGFWADRLPQHVEQCGNFVSPFTVLGTRYTLDILKELVKLKVFQKQHFYLLLHDNLVDLDFSLIPNYEVDDDLMEMVFTRCKKLRRLKICDGLLSRELLFMIPVKYPNIEHLYIDVPCSSDLLKTIQTHCHCLKSLEVKVDSDTLPRLELLKSLKGLSLNRCLPNVVKEEEEEEEDELYMYEEDYDPWDFIDDDGNGSSEEKHSWMDIMANLSSTNSFSFKGLYKSRYPTALDTTSTAFRHVLSLSITKAAINIEDIQKIFSVMENLSDLCISKCSSLNTKVFCSLEKLSNLTSLRMPHLKGRYIAFDGNVKSYLLKCGKYLKVLDLSGFDDIDVNVIASSCPNVEELKLLRTGENILNWITRDQLSEEALQRHTTSNKLTFSLFETCIFLKRLYMSGMYFRCNDDRDDGGFDFDRVFRGSDNLEVLTFSKIIGENQTTFSKYLLQFKCESIECLDLSDNRLGKDAFMYALTSFPNLKKLTFKLCDIFEEECNDIRTLLGACDTGIDINITPLKYRVF